VSRSLDTAATCGSAIGNVFTDGKGKKNVKLVSTNTNSTVTGIVLTKR
jgi:hypothetical protein